MWHKDCERIVELPRGISRHEVVFVNYDGNIYAIKELPFGVAEVEYGYLRKLEELGLPSVSPIGHGEKVTVEGEENGSVLITAYLNHSIPYRTLFNSRGYERYSGSLLDAIAGLMVRLHLAGFYWGDCSLSNTLFKRDAGQLQAHVVDVETAENHANLSTGQREVDLEILSENIAGEIADLQAEGKDMTGRDIHEILDGIISRYRSLWEELNSEELIFIDERYKIHERIEALNELGFSIDEVILQNSGDGNIISMLPIVTDQNYHRNKLLSLTGISAEVKQARLMLNDIRELRATISLKSNRSIPLSVAAYKWQTEIYIPSIASMEKIGDEFTDSSEYYCDLLEHKWYLSENAGKDVGMETAIKNYLEIKKEKLF